MATKPVILAVDDDGDVLRPIKGDLRQLSGRDETVALLVVDQRMPGMGGVDFLEQAIKLYPDCKRILLTAYADTEAAIKAINTVKTDYYLLKPWDPPEEQLYPVLTDLLDEAQKDRLLSAQRDAAPPGLASLALSEREDALADWLDAQGAPERCSLSSSLAEAGFTEESLNALGVRIPDAGTLAESLAWLGSRLEAVALLRTVEQSAGRISDLVTAIKAYSYMDQAPQQEVDGRGHLFVRTAIEDAHILVEIGDDGPDIAPDVQRRIFEPFFTTEGVGKGTGLGLDTAYQIVVTRHHGDLRVVSEPGNTRFQVRLPVSSPSSSAS